jgi:hypothetical protein
MATKFYFYGEVAFNATQKRTAAGRRLDNLAGRTGFVTEVWPDLITWYGSWPAGWVAVTVEGRPALRFCYSTMDPALAEEAFNEVAAAWDVFQDSNSSWGTAAVTVPG